MLTYTSQIYQAADAISFLHTLAGIVHGNINCVRVVIPPGRMRNNYLLQESILISDDGDAILTDFRSSTSVFRPETEKTTFTSNETSLFRLSLRFAAPEILSSTGPSGLEKRQRPRTAASDAYAFGMTILQASYE